MLQILYSSGGLFTTKMDIKSPVEIRIVAKFSTFMASMDIFLTDLHIFFLLQTFLQKKSARNLIKTRGGEVNDRL